ncbi:MAG TPA: amidophosphoribosyltransferase [Nitrospiraceae bacterium]|nr:amidophosphoribosyltransferase [Nitrospiraceae bacterium]
MCGIFGVFNHPEASNLVYLGLHGLQHRGQEGSGIVSSDGNTLYCEKGIGLVSEIFKDADFSRLKGHSAIGHNRYSTYGESVMINVQPIVVNYALGSMALAHNGNLVNAHFLRSELEAYGSIFQSTVDSEVIIHLIAISKGRTFLDRVIDSLKRVKGAYSLLILTEKELIGVRDSYGFRPLSLGEMDGSYILTSESSTFDLIGAKFIRDILPGEIVVISDRGVDSYMPFTKTREAMCIFEHIYFARPDSYVFGESVNLVRRKMGYILAKESNVEADIVIPVPDSGVPAALGYSEGGGLPYDNGIIRSHYVGRTFIEPKQSIRHFGVRLKLNPVREVLKGKRVVVVDDSIVRGTTSRKIVSMIRESGAREVHMRIASPPVRFPCFYGIDTPTRKELIASKSSVEETRRHLSADTLGYISIEGMLKAVSSSPEKFCVACFNGEYPIPFTNEEIRQLGLFDDSSDPE